MYVAAFGFIGITSTDKLQLLGVFCLFAFLFYFIVDNSELITLSNFQEMNRNYLEIPEFGWTFILGMIFIFPWISLCSQEYWQRIVAAKSDKVAKYSIGMSIVAFSVFATITFAITIIFKAKYGFSIDQNNYDVIILNAVNDYQSILIVTPFIVGLVLAIVSTIDTYLNSMMLSSIAIFNALTGNKQHSVQSLTVVHYTTAFVSLCMTLYYMFTIDADFNLWIFNAFGAATAIMPAFIAALLKKYNHLATNIVGFSRFFIYSLFYIHRLFCRNFRGN